MKINIFIHKSAIPVNSTVGTTLFYSFATSNQRTYKFNISLITDCSRLFDWSVSKNNRNDNIYGLSMLILF